MQRGCFGSLAVTDLALRGRNGRHQIVIAEKQSDNAISGFTSAFENRDCVDPFAMAFFGSM